MAGTGQLQATADHGAVQGGNHRHRTVLHTFQCRMPHARVVHALAGVALLQFAQIQPGAEMDTFAVNHCRADACRHVFEQVA